MKNNRKGFTLIEVMIAVAIVGILTAVAVPVYTSHVQDTRRSEAQRTLVEAAQHLENFYAVNMTYSSAVDDGSLLYYTSDTNFTDYYTLTVEDISSTSYTLKATPDSSGAQASDSCGTLTLDQLNQTGADDSDCW